jgi:exodeoxyribonuclease VII large subunit
LWLVGEISGFNKSAHKKHVGFSLVELSPSGERTAEVHAILFGDVRRSVEAKLAAAGDPFRLEDEIQVRLSVRVDLFDSWGQYRVRVEDLDVAYTLGEAARRREQIVRRLGEAGLLDRNSSLPMPDLPLRVGLITSLGSDAMNDVLKTLRESGFGFEVTVHGARVQGKATEPSVRNALDRLREGPGEPDVVVICRGGGSRTDLSWFDSEALGRAVALFPIPVIVGIGHEQDVSVLDHVARRAKTPTAAAQKIVQQVRDALERVEQAGRAVTEGAGALLLDASRLHAERARSMARLARGRLELERAEGRRRRERIVHAARAAVTAARREMILRTVDLPRRVGRRLDMARLGLLHASRQMVQGARRDLSTSSARVDELAHAVAPRADRLLGLAAERVEARARRLSLVDPHRVVERGYAIVRGPSGRVIHDSESAPAGTELRLTLRRGKLRARSDGPDPSPSEGNIR